MTGQNAGPVRLLLRAPPHLPFVQSYPGIIPGGGRPAATVQGTVEVRTSAVKAKWVRVEIRKHESVPSSVIGKGSGQSSTVHVGSPHLLWKPPEGKEFDTLSTADFRFCIPFPGDAPPTTELRGCKISYELIAAVCYKGKGGLFKKDSSSIATVNEPISIIKYELASAWPAYNQLEQRTASALNGAVSLVVDRPIQAFGPGDRIVVTATMKSEAQNQFRLKGFEMALVEILTVHPPKPDPKKKAKPPSPPVIRRQPVCTTRVVADGQVIPGGERGARLDLVVPQDRQLLTVRGAKEFQVEYELVVEATCDGGPSKVLLGGLQCIIGTFARSSAQTAVKEIGFVQGLCPRPPPGTGHQPSSSIPGSVTGSSKTGSQDNHHPALTPPLRGHQTSMSADGFLTAEPSSYFRPLSMNPPPKVFNTPSPPPPLPPLQQGYQVPPLTYQQPPYQQQQPPYQQQQPPYQQQQQPADHQQQLQTPFEQQPPYQQQQQQQPNAYQPQIPVGQQWPMQGFVPRQTEWRRTSSGTTTTTTTTFTDHGPIPERNVATMPARLSQNYPSTPPHRVSDAAFGPLEEESLYERPQSEISNNRFSAASPGTGTFGQWNLAAVDRTVHSSSPTTTMTTVDDTSVNQHTARPESVNSTPTRAAPGWSTAANEKRRLYEEARNRAANTQAMHGTVLSSIGMEADGSTAPPEYTPPPQSATPIRNIQAQSPLHDSPQSIHSGHQPHQTIRVLTAPSPPVQTNGSAAPAPPSEDPIPYEALFASSSSPGPSTDKAPAPLSRRSSPAAYMTATQEKDLMRQRYEEAQAGVSRYSALPNGHSPPPSSTQSPHSVQQQFTGTGAEGDATRRQSEERARGNRSVSVTAATVPSPGASSQASPRSPQMQQAYMSAAEEKALMRKRYEEATNAVNRAAAPGSPIPSTSTQPGPANSGSLQAAPQTIPAAYMTAAEEKEMMRKRYEEATGAVNRAANSGPSSQASPTTPQTSTMAQVSSIGHSSTVPQSQRGPSTASPTLPAAYMSAAEEKEVMRRRFEEATSAVNRAAATSSGAGPSSSVVQTSPQSNTQHRSSTPAAYMTAADEKEMMRKRYEHATSAVNRANQSSPLSSPQRAQSMYSQQQAGATAASSSSTGPSNIPAVYMSATQEKEMMRKRYEEATSAVARAAEAGPSSAPVAAEPSSSFTTAAALPPPSDQPIPYDQLFGPPPAGALGPSGSSSSSQGPQASVPGSAENGGMREWGLRDEEATMKGGHGGSRSSMGASAPQRSMTLRERMMSALPDGPPPPLAPRPPREYVEMLQHRNA